MQWTVYKRLNEAWHELRDAIPQDLPWGVERAELDAADDKYDRVHRHVHETNQASIGRRK